MSGSKSILLTAHRSDEVLSTFSTSGADQAWGWCLTRSKGMKDLAAFTVRKVKRAAAEEKREEYSSAVRVKVKGKMNPTSHLKIKGKEPFGGVEERENCRGQHLTKQPALVLFS